MVLGFKTQSKGQPTGFVEKIRAGTKIHTFRKDANDRWKAGKLIQFATGVRTKNYKQFKADFCRGVQKIRIEPWHDEMLHGLAIYVDDNKIAPEQLAELVKNDGFDSLSDFYEWFGAGFEGKIIHWTDKRY